MIKGALLFLLVVVSLGVGFFGGYLINRDDAQTGPEIVIHSSSNISSIPRTLSSNSGFEAPSAEYASIAQQVTIFDKLHLAHQVAAEASIEQLERYIMQAVRSSDPLYNYNLLSIFLERYTALDPAAALDFVDANPTVSNDRFIPHIVTSWVRVDPEAAIDYYKSLTNKRLKTQLGARLLSDPTLAANGFSDEIIETLGERGEAIAGAMSAQNLPPAVALEEALKLNPRARNGAVQTALIRWLRQDPDGAIQRIQQHGNYEERTQMFQSILHEYVSIDEDAAFAFAAQYLKGNVRIEQQTLSMLGHQNAKRTLPLVEDFIARTGNASPLRSIVATWVQQEPLAAIAYIDTVDESQRKDLLQSAAFGYVNSHPDEGFAWLMSKQDTHPNLVHNTLRSSINDNTIDIAQLWIPRTTDDQTRAYLIAEIANFQASRDPDASLKWLERYSGEPAYASAVQNVISSMAHQSPRDAAAALEGRLDDENAAPLAGTIAANWYRASPTDAMNWINGLENGEIRANALSNVVMMVVQSDRDEAISLVQTIPEGQYRDNAKRNIAYTLISQKPEDVEEVIAELDINSTDAKRMRELAKSRSKNKTNALGLPFRS